MLVFDAEKIELLIAQCRFSEAAAALTALRVDERDAVRRRLLAGVYALGGNERALARIVEPSLLGCRTAADVVAHHAARGGGDFYDDLVGGIVLTWLGAADDAYALLRQAHDVAFSERRFHVAVATRERLAHHALLFGDVERARNELDEAIGVASDRALPDLLTRCLIAAARLALYCGDPTGSARRLERALSLKRSSAILALCAPIGVQLAAESGDDATLRSWISPEIVDTSLHSDDPEPAMAATVALLIASAASPDEIAVAMATRRALFSTENPAMSPELFSMTARYGDLGVGRLAVRTLAAVVAPRRRYLRAHYLLARAHLAFRTGQASWIDHASDAARAFNAIGLRRWTNEAMLLMVRQKNARRGTQSRPAGATLTEREQQVADLIRRGARNREVALALQISEHTVERHVSSILGRLGLRSRWQISDIRKKTEH
ncbi:MAG TPA: LuxR C-terminal-related transcriptional regulator [Candidatus Cybelea sp.]|jgi:DNA-binding CsgD family transcriptional regulator|nr:LuxR C-terminal-related transcriptional regulator [Candidatus Cybelea sp.]